MSCEVQPNEYGRVDLFVDDYEQRLFSCLTKWSLNRFYEAMVI